MSSVKLVLLVAATTLLPAAGASGSLDAGILVVHVEDGHGTDCSRSLAGFCFLNVTGMEGGIGNATVNASQTLSYVGVATNLSAARGPAGDLWVVPDQNVTFHASRHYARHPVYRTLVETWQNGTEGRWPSEEHQVDMSSERVAIECYCPGTAGGGDVTESRHRTYTPTPWSDHCVTYEHVGPCNAYSSTSNDFVVRGNVARLCMLDGIPCDATLSPAVDTAENHTPTVIVGLQYSEAQVATDPSSLTMGAIQDAPPPPPSLPKRDESAGLADPADGERASLDPHPEPWPYQPLVLKGGTPTASTAVPWSQNPQATRQHELPRAWLHLGVVVVAATAMFGLLALILWISLYSRFSSKKELLASPVRRQIVEFAKDSPGIHIQEVATRMGLTRQTVTHHVLLLRRAHLLEVARDGWRTHLYVPGSKPCEKAASPSFASAPLLRQRVLSLLRGTPEGILRSELHELLPDAPKRKRNKVLRRLVQERLVHEVESGTGQVRLRLSAPATAGGHRSIG